MGAVDELIDKPGHQWPGKTNMVLSTIIELAAHWYFHWEQGPGDF